MKKISWLYLFFTAFISPAFPQSRVRSSEKSYRFDFGQGVVQQGYVQVLPQTTYTPETGYGIDLRTTPVSNLKKGKNPSTDGYLTSDKPFYFSVKLPEGNYRIKVTLGDDTGTCDAAIRTESRRMMVNRVQTAKGQHKTVEFTVNIRDSLIPGTNRQVRIKPSEHTNLHWDDKLTLEFNGQQPKVNAVEITPENPAVVTVFLLGNSTVVDQSKEPFAAWGQMIPAFFQPGKVAVANYAESGLALRSFIAQRRLEKILKLMKPGDYALVEFGHNDQKEKGEGIGAFTSYKKDLEYFIAEVKKRGGTPVLVTSVQRRTFDSAGTIKESLGDYPAAVRQTAQEQHVPLIDLNTMTKTMYEAWGPQESINAFVHFPAGMFPNKPDGVADNTHFRPFGAYEVARLVAKGITDARLPLVKALLPSTVIVDPAHPDLIGSFYWPMSPLGALEKPDGN